MGDWLGCSGLVLVVGYIHRFAFVEVEWKWVYTKEGVIQ